MKELWLILKLALLEGLRDRRERQYQELVRTTSDLRTKLQDMGVLR